MESIFEEIEANSEMVEDLNGAASAFWYMSSPLSWYFGNRGYICTWTVECMVNCS